MENIRISPTYMSLESQLMSTIVSEWGIDIGDTVSWGAGRYVGTVRGVIPLESYPRKLYPWLEGKEVNLMCDYSQEVDRFLIERSDCYFVAVICGKVSKLLDS